MLSRFVLRRSTTMAAAPTTLLRAVTRRASPSLTAVRAPRAIHTRPALRWRGGDPGKGKGDDWAPPSIEELQERYHALHQKRMRYALAIAAGMCAALAFRLARNKSRTDDEIASRDQLIAKLKEGQNTGAMANSVLAIVDTARDSKQDYAVMRARLVQHFDALKVSAAAPAPAPTAVAPAKAAPAAANA